MERVKAVLGALHGAVGDERARRDDWREALAAVEAHHGVGVGVHDDETREPLRETEADEAYDLLRFEGEFRVVGDVKAWRTMGRELRCPNS
eukprot:1563704-Prymnesium_polylepis.1